MATLAVLFGLYPLLLVALAFLADVAIPYYLYYFDSLNFFIGMVIAAGTCLMLLLIGCILIPGVTLASEPGLFRHRFCPECGGQIPWVRWIRAMDTEDRWPCEHCGEMLRLSIQRRVAQPLVLAVVLLLLASLYLYLPSAISNSWVFVALAGASGFLVVAFAVPFLDGAVLASEPIPRPRLDICGLFVLEVGYCLVITFRGWFVHPGESPRTTSILLGVAIGMLLIAFMYLCSWFRAKRNPAREEEGRDSMRLQEYDVVRVIKLRRDNRHYDGTDGVARPPAVGDVGTIVDSSDEPTDPVIVESVDENGYTVWLADFDRHELELVERPSGR